ncbi:Cytochrome P450 4V2 [Chamberlinius hualienensis]
MNIIDQKRSKLEQSKMANHVNNSESDEVLGMKRQLATLDLMLESSIVDNNCNASCVMNHNEIFNEVHTLIVAGFETLSSSISLILFCLANYPQVQNKVIEELDEIFGDSNRDVNPEDFSRMKYLECVMKETMRLFTPLPMIGRNLSEDLDICGYKVPAGTEIVLLLNLIHRDPSVYEDPDTFNPDRFLAENSLNRDPYAFIPFSAGPRNCIGHKFSMMELKVTLSKVLRRFTMKSPVDLATVERQLIHETSLKSNIGFPIQFEPRNR